MYSIKDILTNLCIGILLTVLIVTTGTWIVNDVVTYRSENENIVCTISKIEKRRVLVGKTYTYRYKIFTEEFDETISSPKDIIRDMYEDKDKYIGGKIEVIKIRNYNRKNELIGIDYELR